MNLVKYHNKRVKIILSYSNTPLIGMANYFDSEDSETLEDGLVVKSEEDKQYYEVLSSEIKSIEIM